MSVRSDRWGALADQAITDFEAADTGTETPHAYAYMMGAIGWRSGWGDVRIPTYLDKLYSLRNPDGGWGLNFTYDKFNDGTVNPANTTYTVTIADHVGPVLLNAYDLGLVPGSDISTLVKLVMTANTFMFSNGACVSYSRHANDNINATNDRCIHNVNALAAMFLQQANSRGFSHTGLHARIVDITRHEVAMYNAGSDWWPYRGDFPLSSQDADHNAAMAEAFYTTLSYPIGREVAYRMMTTSYSDNAMAPMAHMRLTGLPGGPGSMSGDSTLWLTLGDNWLFEAEMFVNNPPNNRARSQAAYWTARNAAVS